MLYYSGGSYNYEKISLCNWCTDAWFPGTMMTNSTCTTLDEGFHASRGRAR